MWLLIHAGWNLNSQMKSTGPNLQAWKKVAVIEMRQSNVFQQYYDVIKWKHFQRYWPFVWGIHRSPVNFDVFFDLCLNKRLSRQSRRWWSETPSHSLSRHCNDLIICWWNQASWFISPRLMSWWHFVLSLLVHETVIFNVSRGSWIETTGDKL